ncbi:LysR family transcriptional regulator [Cupriavidus plantarum]|uniref:LysR family transcriptional regulator n=1 Tax=Cupriavidus plantarum TaxID=942865 RepID=UPI000E24ACC0|nr:LysR family transcriptional regulator [Cupriavidus plantarum]REE92153.1 DNA-binding transcriptional LysR family regulator [Cupriavidus plantarum]
MPMNSDDLSIFALVADSGSFSAAALAGGVDASSISRRVTQLEKQLGTRLFHRTGRGVSLTEQGSALLVHARQIRDALAAAESAVSNNAGLGPTRIRIAAQPTIARTVFGDLYHVLHRQFPRTRLHFTEGLASSILADLQAGTIDIAILYRPEYPGSMSYEPLLMERLYLLTPPGFAMTQARVDAQGLQGVPMILPSTHHGIRVFVEAMAARRGHSVQLALESDGSNAITAALVHKGCGCTVLPLAAVPDDIAAGRLRGFPLPGDDAERCISLVLGRTDLEPATLWALGAAIREVAAGLVKTGAWPGARLLTADRAAPQA